MPLKLKFCSESKKMYDNDCLRVLAIADKNVPKKKQTARYVESPVPFAPEYSTFDIQISARATYEDIAYSKDAQLRKDVRRGNTIIARKVPFDDQCHAPEIKLSVKSEPDYALENPEWLRRGLQKFFDCYYEFLNHGDLTEGSFKKGVHKHQFVNKERYKNDIRAVIFYELEKAMLEQSCAVDIYKLLKANGENAQVGFYTTLDAWAISSKNVCILARTPEDIQNYTTGRAHFSALIAQAWFAHLATMAPELQAELKQQLAGHTLVGEYVGNQEHQHLVKYNEIMILFYALVQNDSSATCCPPLQAYAMFKKFGLRSVPATKVGSYTTVADFYAEMNNQWRSVAAADIENGEEGCVLYFVRNPIAGDGLVANAEEALFGASQAELAADQLENVITQCQEQYVFSLCKLKTLEYRLFRKIREKIKSTTAENKDKKMKDFQREMAQLCEGNDLPKPPGYYHALAAVALDKTCSDPEAKELAASKYIDFLTVIQAEVENSDIPD